VKRTSLKTMQLDLRPNEQQNPASWASVCSVVSLYNMDEFAETNVVRLHDSKHGFQDP